MRFLDRFRKQRSVNLEPEEELSPHELALEALKVVRPGFYEAIVGMSKDDCEATRLQFHKIVLSGTFWHPIEHQPDGTTSLNVIKLPGGGIAFPVYTEPESMALDGQRREGHMLISIAKLIFQTAEKNGFEEVHINPSGPAGGAIVGKEIPFLARGRSPYGPIRDEGPTSATASVPEEPLPGLIGARVREVAEREGVPVYFVDVTVDGKEIYPTIYFDFTQRPEDSESAGLRIQSDLAPLIEGTPYVLSNPVVDADQLSSYVVAGAKLFPST